MNEQQPFQPNSEEDSFKSESQLDAETWQRMLGHSKQLYETMARGFDKKDNLDTPPVEFEFTGDKLILDQEALKRILELLDTADDESKAYKLGLAVMEALSKLSQK